MNPVPGTSKMIENSNQGHSKKKCKLYHERGTSVSLTGIDILPDEMMIEIFSHLSVKDKLRVQKVCSRWNYLVRNEVLWRSVNISDISSSFLVELLTSLPACVSQIRIRCNEIESAIPLTFLEIMAKLHNQFPHLNTVIFENIHFTKHIESEEPIYDNYFTLTGLTKSVKKILEYEFCKEEDIDFMPVVLSELKILSLRNIYFSKFFDFSHIKVPTLPNLRVLDLSYSQYFGRASLNCESFCTLVNLEELYFSAWDDTQIFLKKISKLRVLDLEECRLDDVSFSFIKENCVALEELYLAHNNICHIYKSEIDKDFFSKLHTLCLININVTSQGIENLLAECPSLKYVDVSGCILVEKTWYDDLSKDIKEVLFFDFEFSDNISHCDHFSKSKYCNF